MPEATADMIERHHVTHTATVSQSPQARTRDARRAVGPDVKALAAAARGVERAWRRSPAWLVPRSTLPPLWRELGAGRVLAQAAGDRTWASGGDPVLLIPGFLAGDASLDPLARHLARCGFRPCPSGIGCNVACSEETVERMTARLEALAADGERIGIVGHSRGGVIARVLARRRPDLVAGVVTLGAPHLDHLAVHPVF